VEKDLILVGKIVKPHSIRGDVTVEIYCDDPDVFVEGKRLVISGNGVERDVFISGINGNKKGRLILHFQGVDTRNDAENLRNCSLFVYRDELSKTGESEYYFCDLLGCRVESEDGEFFGRVSVIFEGNDYPILRIVEEDKKKEIELPFISKFIKEVYPEKKIVVDGEIYRQLLLINYPE